VPVLVLLSVGPFVAWKAGSVKDAALALRAPALVSVLLAAAIAVTVQASLGVAVGLLLAIWILLGTLQHVQLRLKAPAGGAPSTLAARWRLVPRAFWGMVVAHAGVGVFVLGVTLVKGTEHVQDASLQEGGSVSVGGYTFQLQSMAKRKGPNYLAGRARFEVRRDGELVTTLYPEKRFYIVQRMPMTEAAIDRGLTRDLYVSLGDTAPNGAWGVRVQVKPFMGWVWGGAVVMALGGLLAATDRRYRAQRRRQQQAKPHAPLPDAALASSLSSAAPAVLDPSLTTS